MSTALCNPSNIHRNRTWKELHYLSRVSEDYWLMDVCVESLLYGSAVQGFQAAAPCDFVVAHVA